VSSCTQVLDDLAADEPGTADNHDLHAVFLSLRIHGRTDCLAATLLMPVVSLRVLRVINSLAATAFG
jgi:hypothetical protein